MAKHSTIAMPPAGRSTRGVIDFASLGPWLLVIILVIGLTLLCLGGDWLARGAVSLALKLNISQVVVGLTVVSVATSMPEVITCFIATSKGSPGLAMGNILGSNIANIGLILGLTAILRPLDVQARLIRQESPILFGITVLFAILCWGTLGRIDGIVLLLLMAGYLFFIVDQARRQRMSPEEFTEESPEPVGATWKVAGLLLAGAAGLGIGAELVYGSSVEIARMLGVSETLIGLTIVAVATSLPELAASIAAALRKHSDIVAGNIVGSNIFNIVLIGGGVSTVYTLPVEQTLYRIEFPAMLLLTAVLWWSFFTGGKVSRREGAVFLTGYWVIIGLSTVFNQ